ncbi:MAG: PQQ-binding-like beta-propeller repeat protein [Bacteroidota bacterium]
MKGIYKHLCLYALLIFTLISPVFSQIDNSGSWTQFRGQFRSGISNEILPQMDWSKSEPKLLWKKEIGSGFSELIISDGVVYTMFSEQTDSITGLEYIAAYYENTGNELWRSKVDSVFIEIDGWGNGPRSTPTIGENFIYSLSGYGKLSANSKKDGKLIWQVDFVKEFGSTVPRWGYSSSPLLIDNMLIIEVGDTNSRAFTAFNKNNGKLIWTKGKGEASYSSPLLATIDGQKQIIFANGRTLSSYTPKGDTLWTFKMPLATPTAIPVHLGSNKLFVSALRGGFVITKTENNKTTEVLKGNSMKNDFSSSCYYDGHLYGFHVAALRCISAETGEVKWTKRGYGKGSLILVDDMLLVLSDQGKLVLIDAKPDVFNEKGSIQTISGKSWTAPSFYKGKVFVRNLTEMACFKIK